MNLSTSRKFTRAEILVEWMNNYIRVHRLFHDLTESIFKSAAFHHAVGNGDHMITVPLAVVDSENRFSKILELLNQSTTDQELFRNFLRTEYGLVCTIRSAQIDDKRGFFDQHNYTGEFKCAFLLPTTIGMET